MNPFNWLRSTVKAAFLGGIQDAIAELNQAGAAQLPAIDVTPTIEDESPKPKKAKAKE